MTPFRSAGAKASPATVSVRRTRSRLGESVMLGEDGGSNGTTNGGTDASGTTSSFSRGLAGMHRSTRSSASSMGSPGVGSGTHRGSNAGEQHAQALGVSGLSPPQRPDTAAQQHRREEEEEEEEDEGDDDGVEEPDDEDVDAAYDELDDDDGMDVDAEGEDDEDVVMGGVVA